MLELYIAGVRFAQIRILPVIGLGLPLPLDCPLVALSPVPDLLFCAKHLFAPANRWKKGVQNALRRYRAKLRTAGP
jgi:hypothetical protein